MCRSADGNKAEMFAKKQNYFLLCTLPPLVFLRTAINLKHNVGGKERQSKLSEEQKRRGIRKENKYIYIYICVCVCVCVCVVCVWCVCMCVWCVCVCVW